MRENLILAEIKIAMFFVAVFRWWAGSAAKRLRKLSGHISQPHPLNGDKSTLGDRDA